MNESIQEGLHHGYFDLVIRWLGERDEGNVEKATLILRKIGPPVVEFLILEARKPGTRATHCIAILHVIQQIGGPLGPDEMFGLQTLLQHRNTAVSQKAEQVIMSLAPGGIPDDPEELALMRAFNPFLAPLPRCRPRRTRQSDFVAALQGDRAASRRRTRSNVAWQKREERERGKRS